MAARNRGLTIEPVWEAAADLGPAGAGHRIRGGPLPPALAARFPGELAIPLRPDRPTVVANFVSTLDGAVAPAAGRPSRGGGEVSGFSGTDRLMMAILRALADAVVIGAGTFRAGRRHAWSAEYLEPGLADAFAAWRTDLGLAPRPTTVVVSGSGDLDPGHAGLNDPAVPVIVATTPAGWHRLSQSGLPSNVRVAVLEAGDGGAIPAAAVLESIAGHGVGLVLCEGGPTLFGCFLEARLVDELFLTLAPQVFGRAGSARPPALVEGADLAGGDRWAELRSVRRAGDDLYLRYRFLPLAPFGESPKIGP